MADNKRPGYAGSIQNTGAQKVNAPFSQNVKKGNGQVKTATIFAPAVPAAARAVSDAARRQPRHFAAIA